MRAVAVVQARMGSTRLPGKSLAAVWRDVSLLELVLRRVAAARRLDEVVLATGDGPQDQPLAALAARMGLPVHRGPVDDVLARFAGALEAHPGDVVVRVCADNPFVAPEALDALLELFARERPDYAENAGPASGLPDGAGAEAMTADALRAAAAEAREPDEREHVTPFVRARPERFRLAVVPPPEPSWPRVKLDVDTAEDLERMRAVAAALPGEGAPLWPLAAVVEAYARALSPSA